MPLITLLTDFGLSDNYVGVMKGVICAICPDATIIDLTHQIPPQDITVAAYSLMTAYRFFPDYSVHLAVVDPGVGSGRDIIAMRTGRGFFIAPDNGLLSPVIDAETVYGAVAVKNAELFLHPVSSTFHGRDIFAPAAAHLAVSGDLDRLGPRIALGNLVRLDILSPEVTKDGITGKIIAVDRFGNLVTNISIREITGLQSDVSIVLRGKRIEGISHTYASVDRGVPLALIGSGDMLEISVNRGDAGLYFNAGIGEIVQVCKRPDSGGRNSIL